MKEDKVKFLQATLCTLNINTGGIYSKDHGKHVDGI